MQSNDSATRANSRLRAWVADWGNALPLLIAAYALVYLWLMSGAEDSTWAHVVHALAFIPMNFGAALLALRASRRPDTDARIRRALLLIGLAFTSVLLGNVTAFRIKFYENGNPLSAWTNILYFGLYVLGLAGLLSFPLARRVSNEYRKFLLDAATVVVAGGLAIWYLVIITTRTYELDGFSGTFFGLAYPICSLLLLLGVVTAILRRPAQRNAAASNVLLAGMVLYLLSDLANDLTILENGWGGVSYTDVTYMASYILITSAFARYFWKAPVVVDEQDVKSRSQQFNYLPYIGVALCYALLGVVAVRRWPDQMSVLAIGGIVITFLVVVRQIAAVRENVRLLSDQSKRENEARFEALVRHSTDVITIVDADGIIRYVCLLYTSDAA